MASLDYVVLCENVATFGALLSCGDKSTPAVSTNDCDPEQCQYLTTPCWIVETPVCYMCSVYSWPIRGCWRSVTPRMAIGMTRVGNRPLCRNDCDVAVPPTPAVPLCAEMSPISGNTDIHIVPKCLASYQGTPCVLSTNQCQ